MIKTIFIIFLSLNLYSSNYFSKDYITISDFNKPDWSISSFTKKDNVYGCVGISNKGNTTLEKYNNAITNSKIKLLSFIFKDLKKIEIHFTEETKIDKNIINFNNLYLILENYVKNKKVLADIQYDKYQIKVFTVISKEKIKYIVYNYVKNKTFNKINKFQKLLIKDLIFRYFSN